MKCPDPHNITYAKWLPPAARAVIEHEFTRQDSWIDSWKWGNESAREEIDIWFSFANDERMDEVYSNLEEMFPDLEATLYQYLDSAWAARMGSLKSYRDRFKKAAKLGPKVQKKALELIELIEESFQLGEAPAEFSSPVWLLRAARENPRRPWLGRRHIVGTETEPAEIDRHLWEGAPRIPEMLDALANVAVEWRLEPEDDAIGAALKSRQTNELGDYTRAFLYLLEARRIPVTPQSSPELLRAIESTIAVVLDIDDDNEGIMRAIQRALKDA